MEITVLVSKCLSGSLISPCKTVEMPDLGIPYFDAKLLHVNLSPKLLSYDPWDSGSKGN